jgi:hypothetical protein
MIIAEKIEGAVNRLLQQQIAFTVNGKTLKSGRLILFCIKDFYLVFTIQNENVKKHFEIPYPYGFFESAKRVVFDYSLARLCQKNSTIETHAKLLPTLKKPNKFFNACADIRVVEN